MKQREIILLNILCNMSGDYLPHLANQETLLKRQNKCLQCVADTITLCSIRITQTPQQTLARRSQQSWAPQKSEGITSLGEAHAVPVSHRISYSPAHLPCSPMHSHSRWWRGGAFSALSFSQPWDLPTDKIFILFHFVNYSVSVAIDTTTWHWLTDWFAALWYLLGIWLSF